MTAEEAKSNQTPSQPSHVKPFPLPKPDRLTDMEQSLKGPKKSGTYSPVKKRTSTGVYPSRPVSALVKGESSKHYLLMYGIACTLQLQYHAI